MQLSVSLSFFRRCCLCISGDFGLLRILKEGGLRLVTAPVGLLDGLQKTIPPGEIPVCHGMLTLS